MDIKNRKGSILIMTLLIFVVLMIFGTFILGFMVNENKMSLNHQYKTQAYYIARSGAVAVEAAILEMDEEEIKKVGEELEKGTSIKVRNIDFDGIAEVELKKDNDKLIIISKAIVGDMNNTVTKILDSEAVGNQINLDFALFGGSRIAISGNPNINGKIGTNQAENSGVTINDKKNFVVEYEQDKTYPNIIFPTICDIKNESDELVVTSISKSTFYKNSSIKFGSNGSQLVINTNNENIDLAVKGLTIDNDIAINGTGKVRIFIEETLQIPKNPHINKNGDRDNLDIIFYGGQLNIQTNPKIWGDFLVNNSAVNISSNPEIYGSIFANVEEMFIYSKPIDISGNIKISGVLYAPKALVRWSHNGIIDNSIIAKEIEISANPNININNNNIIFPPVEGGSSSTTFKPGYYK